MAAHVAGRAADVGANLIGILDLACCALAMYMLVPNEPHLGFVQVSVIFVAATLLGFASHAPGGLGVFDATMMVALWQFDKEALLAGLLVVPAAVLCDPVRHIAGNSRYARSSARPRRAAIGASGAGAGGAVRSTAELVREKPDLT